MCGCMRGYVHESLGICGANKKVLNKLILELQASKCFLMWVLVAEIYSSAHACNCGPSLPYDDKI